MNFLKKNVMWLVIAGILICLVIAGITIFWPKGQQASDPSAPPPVEQPATPATPQTTTPAGVPGQPAATTATTPTTSVIGISVVSPEGDILELFREVRGYKIAGKTGIDYEGRGVPFEIEIDASLLAEDDRTALTAEVVRQINLPSDKKRTVTALKYIRFTLSRNGKRFESALVAFEGQKDGVDIHQPGKSAGVTIPMSPIHLDEQGSQAFARRLRAELKARFGVVYLGEPQFPSDFPAIVGPPISSLDR